MTGREVRVERREAVAIVTLSRPPHNYFNSSLLAALADELDAVDQDPVCRACVIASDQKSFCAGADFGGGAHPDPRSIYAEAARLASRRKPVVAAVNGAAIGGGLGLAMVADFRVASRETRLQANFARLGISPGFGLTLTLPRVVGAQHARDMFMTARAVRGDEALGMGLIDRLVESSELLDAAIALAEDLAGNAPNALFAMRRLLGLNDPKAFEHAIQSELAVQQPLFSAPDFTEGVSAMREHRAPLFMDLARDDE